jgi:beta-N-acetylhexosaminidase
MAMKEIYRLAHAVLFPVLETRGATGHIARFLDNGGKSLLFDDIGVEHTQDRVSRQMLKRETVDAWHDTIKTATTRAGSLILAANTEINALHRVQTVLAASPICEAGQRMSESELEQVSFEMACGIVDAGINLSLSSAAEVLTCSKHWPECSAAHGDAEAASRVVRSYVRGARRAGLRATLKGFHDYPVLQARPVRDALATALSQDELRARRVVFTVGIEEGVSAVMVGPDRFDECQAMVARPLQAELMTLLRDELEFGGLVMACGIAHEPTSENGCLGDVVVNALATGADLIVLPPGAMPQIADVAASIVNAVESDKLDAARLSAAASAVYKLAGYRPI